MKPQDHQRRLESLLKVFQRAYDGVMREQVTIQKEPDDMEIEQGSVPAYSVNGATIYPYPIDVKTIGGTVQVWGWRIDKPVTVSGYPFEPDDYDYETIGDYRSDAEAAQALFQVIANNAFANTFEGEALAEAHDQEILF